MLAVSLWQERRRWSVPAPEDEISIPDGPASSGDDAASPVVLISLRADAVAEIFVVAIAVVVIGCTTKQLSFIETEWEREERWSQVSSRKKRRKNQ